MAAKTKHKQKSSVATAENAAEKHGESSGGSAIGKALVTPVYACLIAGRCLLFANSEDLQVGDHLFMAALLEHTSVIPTSFSSLHCSRPDSTRLSIFVSVGAVYRYVPSRFFTLPLPRACISSKGSLTLPEFLQLYLLFCRKSGQTCLVPLSYLVFACHEVQPQVVMVTSLVFQTIFIDFNGCQPVVCAFRHRSVIDAGASVSCCPSDGPIAPL